MRRRPLTLFLVVLILVGLVAGAHGYFLARLVWDTGLTGAPEAWASGVIVSGGVLLFLHPVVARSVGSGVGQFLAWPAYVWLGTAFYLLLLLWASDLVLWLGSLRGLEVARRQALAVVGSTFAVVVFGGFGALRLPAVKRVEVRMADWPAGLDGYRIVQISDVHIGSLIGRRFAERLVQRCNALQPDAIAITGDLVDGSVRLLAAEVAPLAELRARDGVYFVTGNHDYYSGADGWVQKLQALGMQVLRNRRVTLSRDGASFELAGVDDLSSSRSRSRAGHDLPRALEGWDPRTPLVLLAHHPSSFLQAQPRGVHLQLSGHTHGGQLWPFGLLVRLQTPYLAGLYRQGRSQLYVSRGTGYWGPPIRILAPAEITELVLRPPPAHS